jgi:hypothetical protein
MYAQILPRHGGPGLLALLLLAAAVPGAACAQAGADPAGRLAPAGLARYSLTDAQLGKIRGGFSLPSGMSFSFGFQQETSVNGAMIQSIIVPDTVLTANLTTIPVYVDGTSLPGGLSSSVPVTVTAMTDAGATSVQTTLSSGGVVNSITNSLNNQAIVQVSRITLSVSGLATAADAAETANRVLEAGTLGVGLP